MEYILKNVSSSGIPTDNGDETVSMAIMITVGIEGDTYNFIQLGTSSITFPKTATVDDIEVLMAADGQTYVETNYPTI